MLPRHAWKQFAQTVEVAKFGPELVAPLGDTVRLVDREECQLKTGQNVDRSVAQKALGGDVE